MIDIGYQEAFIYSKNNKYIKNVINEIKEETYNNYMFSLSKVTIKQDIGELKKGNEILMIYGDRLNRIQDVFNMLDLNVKNSLKFMMVGIDSYPYFDVFQNDMAKEYFDIDDNFFNGKYVEVETNLDINIDLSIDF